MAENKAQGTVNVANGAGNTPIEVDWYPGDTVANILERANITIQPGQAATLGKRRIKRPERTPVESGATIVIAGKISNGR